MSAVPMNGGETERLQEPDTAALRMLAMDAVEKARCGQPGMPMGMAEIAAVLWQGHLRHNPANPHWANRDRFGESAADRDLWPYFGITAERVVRTVSALLGAGPVEARHTSR